jgi:hypothetical protein
MECGRVKGKGKGHPRTDHEGPEEELRYSCNLSLTSALDVVDGQRHAPATLPPGNIRYTLYRRLGGSQVRCKRVQKISPPTGIRSPDGPARSESLYWLKCTSNTAKRFIMSFKKCANLLWGQPSIQHMEYRRGGVDSLGLGLDLGLGVKGTAWFHILLRLRINGFFHPLPHLHVAWKTILNPVRI